VEKKHLNQSKSLQQAEAKAAAGRREREASAAVVEIASASAGAVCIEVQDSMGQIGWLMGIITSAFPAMKGGRKKLEGAAPERSGCGPAGRCREFACGRWRREKGDALLVCCC
jgi:hypothetical protein